MTNTPKTINQFFENLKNEIRPGCKGAPARREHYNEIKSIHHRHMRHLDYSWCRSTERGGSRFSPEHGFNVPVGMLRHGPSDPRKEKTGRIYKMHRRLVPIIENAPIEDLIRWVEILKIDLVRFGRFPLKQYIDQYQDAKKEHRVYRGKIYVYDEDVEWEKYGQRSYPRVSSRYIRVYTRTGRHQATMHLKTGERKETGLNRLIPNRAKKIKQEKARARKAEARRMKRAQKAHAREIRQVKEAWKVVEKNGKLRSVYDPSTIYQLGKWLTETPEEDHEAGLYCYASKVEAVTAANENSIFADAWTAGKTLVLCRCERKGEVIEYGNKIATEHLRVIEVVEAIEH